MQGGVAMPTLFMPWREFFDEIEKQPRQQEWLWSALFNDRGALVKPAPRKQARPVSRVFRIRRDLESFTDLRGTSATGTRT
jgi:hypothetical protein